MIFSKRFWLAAVVVMVAGGGIVQAQAWQAGASVGLVNAVEKHFRLDEFNRHDVNAWVSFEVDEKVLLRGTFGSLRVAGANAGATLVIGGSPTAPLPDLPDRINYATLGVAYEFWEGEYTSGIFGGVGGYRIEPEATDPALEKFRDARQTVFGWHGGVDGSVRIASRVSVLARVTYHKIKSSAGRSILTANAGVAYRF